MKNENVKCRLKMEMYGGGKVPLFLYMEMVGVL